MAYKLEADESVRRGILRCAKEQMDRAVSELSDGISSDPTRAIHDARKAIKKERSLLRLAGDAMTRGRRRRENGALREAARGLSGARDADVMIASISGLSERFAGQLPATAFESIRSCFEARRLAQLDDTGASIVETRTLEEIAAIREQSRRAQAPQAQRPAQLAAATR